MKELLARMGGSHRLLHRQMTEFQDAGIPARGAGAATLGSKAVHVIIPDTPEARALLKRVGGTVARKQWAFLSEDR